jgi:hypothetical protein
MSGRVALLFFINDNFNFVTRHRAWHEDDFAIRTANTSRSVGQTVDSHNMSVRGHMKKDSRLQALGYKEKAKIKRPKLKCHLKLGT